MIGKLRIASILMFVFFINQNVQAIEMNSGQDKVQLIELYTSEGCSSCPAADKWISQLKDSPLLWQRFIPMAFHVDYWDYIGWEDRFANKAYSARQREYKREGQLSQVYTPGFMVDGKEWRGFFKGGDLSISAKEKVGELKVNQAFDKVDINFQRDLSQTGDEELDFYIARLGFDLSSDVIKGENRGKELHHDFVVLGMKKVTVSANKGQYSFRASMPDVVENAEDQALVVWVSQKNMKKAIQAVGGWM